MTVKLKKNSEYSYGKWEQIDICAQCGHLMTRYDIYEKSCCPNCGLVGYAMPETYSTSRRYVTTYKPPFWKRLIGKRNLGYYEYSGKLNGKIPYSGAILARYSKVISTSPINITAVGIAAGII